MAPGPIYRGHALTNSSLYRTDEVDPLGRRATFTRALDSPEDPIRLTLTILTSHSGRDHEPARLWFAALTLNLWPRRYVRWLRPLAPNRRKTSVSSLTRN